MQSVRRGQPTHSRLELHIAVSGLVDSEMVMESSNGQMAPGTKVNGRIIEPMEKVNSLILMVTYTRVIGSMTKQMVTEYITT